MKPIIWQLSMSTMNLILCIMWKRNEVRLLMSASYGKWPQNFEFLDLNGDWRPPSDFFLQIRENWKLSFTCNCIMELSYVWQRQICFQPRMITESQTYSVFAHRRNWFLFSRIRLKSRCFIMFGHCMTAHPQCIIAHCTSLVYSHSYSHHQR